MSLWQQMPSADLIAIKGILLLFLIMTQKTSIIEETNSESGFTHQEETAELMVQALRLRDHLYTESYCFLTKDFDNRYDELETGNKHQQKRLN